MDTRKEWPVKLMSRGLKNASLVVYGSMALMVLGSLLVRSLLPASLQASDHGNAILLALIIGPGYLVYRYAFIPRPGTLKLRPGRLSLEAGTTTRHLDLGRLQLGLGKRFAAENLRLFSGTVVELSDGKERFTLLGSGAELPAESYTEPESFGSTCDAYLDSKQFHDLFETLASAGEGRPVAAGPPAPVAGPGVQTREQRTFEATLMTGRTLKPMLLWMVGILVIGALLGLLSDCVGLPAMAGSLGTLVPLGLVALLLVGVTWLSSRAGRRKGAMQLSDSKVCFTVDGRPETTIHLPPVRIRPVAYIAAAGRGSIYGGPALTITDARGTKVTVLVAGADLGWAAEDGSTSRPRYALGSDAGQALLGRLVGAGHPGADLRLIDARAAGHEPPPWVA